MKYLICILFISFIIWISCIPSGKSFFGKIINDYKKWKSDYKKWEAEKRKLTALGNSLIQDNNFKILMSELKKLSTFIEVDKWDKEAELELSKIHSQIQRLCSEIDRCKQAFSSSKFQLPLFKQTLQQVNRDYKIPLENMINELQEAIDFTPNSLDEKKELLKELKNRKKELQLQKREVAANMKAIRKKARTESANAGRRIYGYNSKIAARERRSIRYHKFDFLEKYGVYGEGYIEVHHIKPLSEIKESYVLDPVKDLIPVCSNCHSILHRGKNPIAVEELKFMVAM